MSNVELLFNVSANLGTVSSGFMPLEGVLGALV
jgi:hypothetical protein